MGHGIRVHRQHNHGPRVAYTCLLGVLIGLLLELSAPLTGCAYMTLRWGLLMSLVAPLLILNALQRPCRHLRWCFITGGCLIWSIHTTTLLFHPFNNVYRAEDDSWLLMLQTIVLLMAVYGSIGGGVNIGLLKLRDLMWSHPLFQDGTMCPTCAYNIAHLPQSRCPECGTEFTPADVNPVPPPSRREWKRFAAVASIAAAGCAGVYLLFPHALVPFCVASPGNSSWVLDYLRLQPRHSEKLLRPYLRIGNDQTREAAACYLGLVMLNRESDGGPAEPQTIAELSRTALRDPVPMVREMAIQSLGFVKGKDALYKLLPEILEDESPNIRWSALAGAAAGGDEPDERGTPFLIQALDDPDATVRGYVYQRLKGNTGQSFPYNPTGPRDQRLVDQAKWQEWWDARSDQGG